MSWDVISAFNDRGSHMITVIVFNTHTGELGKLYVSTDNLKTLELGDL